MANLSYQKVDMALEIHDLQNFESQLLSTNSDHAIAGQLTEGVHSNFASKCFGLGFLKNKPESSLQTNSMLLLKALESYGVESLPLKSVIENTYDGDFLIQPGLALLKVTDIENNTSIVTQVRGRASGGTVWGFTPDTEQGLKRLEDEGVTVSFHYIQNLIAIDLDLRHEHENGDKVKLKQIQSHIVCANGKTFLNHLNDMLFVDSKNDGFGGFCNQYLYSIYKTEHGFRMLFRITPTETHSTCSTPFSKNIEKKNADYTQSFYKGVSLKYLKKVIGDELLIEDQLTNSKQTLFLDWDCSSTSSPFGLARLPKIVKSDKVNNKINLQNTKAIINQKSIPIPLHSNVFSSLYYDDKTDGKVSISKQQIQEFNQANAVSQHLTVHKEQNEKVEQVKQTSVFQGVASAAINNPISKTKKDIEYKEFSIPSQWKDDAHKTEFADTLYSNFVNNPVLDLYKKSPTMPYQAWFGILCSFRRVRQVLEHLGSTKSKLIIDKAIEWCREAHGWDSNYSGIESIVKDDSHEEAPSTDTINSNLGNKFAIWATENDLGKKLNQAYKGWANQSPFTNSWANTTKSFKTKYKYDPYTGNQDNGKVKQVMGEDGEPISFKTITPDLAKRILSTDPLLPQVLKFSVSHNCFIVTPNYADVLRSAMEGTVIQPITEIFAWNAMQDYNFVTLKDYLMKTYNIKNRIPTEMLMEFLNQIQESTGTAYDHYKVNMFYNAIQDRYNDYKSAKQQGESILGTTKYLDQWLPRLLHIEPSKSATHDKLFKLYGAYGRTLLIGMVQRMMATNERVKVENMLFIRGSSGAGKTEIAKALVSCLFGYNGINGFAKGDEFIQFANALPEEKDDLSNLFGKLILLFDDISTDFLKKNDQGKLKTFLSQTDMKIRLPYERKPSIALRQFITIATSNDQYVLSDITSSRRYFLVDIDAISNETGNFVCDLLDKKTLKPTERMGVGNNSGYIDIDQSRILSLAFGEAFEKGCLGLNHEDRQAINGTTIEATDHLQS